MPSDAPLSIPTVPLADGFTMPLVGLGTYPMKGAGAVSAVASALEQGYRLIDTATQYGNEREVGEGLRASGVDRASVTIQTKLAGWDHVAGHAREGIERSLEALGVDQIDSYLIHWPNPSHDRYVEAWQAMVEARDAGLLRSIGTSNFKPAHIDRLVAETGVVPVVNQIQLSPVLARRGPLAYAAEHAIVVQAWGPLGQREDLLSSPVLAAVAAEVGRSPEQVALRWIVRQGIVVLPKSSHPDRQRANADLFGWDLADEQAARLDLLDLGEASAWDADTHEET